MDAGLIPYGTIDSRDIRLVRPEEVEKYVQCHWFAGLGGWAQAIQLAGFDPTRPVWTASLPCQPWSSAGKQQGEADERHLWPVLRELVRAIRPPTALGEQVSSKLGRSWYSRVRADLEVLGYDNGCADLCAPSTGQEGEGWIVRGDQAAWERIVIGAPHIRQRLFFVAIASSQRVRAGPGGNAAAPRGAEVAEQERQWIRPDPGDGSAAVAGSMGDPNVSGLARPSRQSRDVGQECQTTERAGSDAGGLSDAPPDGRRERHQDIGGIDCGVRAERHGSGPSDNGGVGRVDQSGSERREWREGATDWSESDGDDAGRNQSPHGPVGVHEASDGLVDFSEIDGPGPDQERGSDLEGQGTGWLGKTGRHGSADAVGRLDDTAGERTREPGAPEQGRDWQNYGIPGQAGAWSDFIVIPCRDGKARRIESGSQPLAARIPRRLGPVLAELAKLGLDAKAARRFVRQAGRNRTGRLRAYGNSIVSQVAADFIRAFLMAEQDLADSVTSLPQ